MESHCYFSTNNNTQVCLQLKLEDVEQSFGDEGYWIGKERKDNYYYNGYRFRYCLFDNKNEKPLPETRLMIGLCSNPSQKNVDVTPSLHEGSINTRIFFQDLEEGLIIKSEDSSESQRNELNLDHFVEKLKDDNYVYDYEPPLDLDFHNPMEILPDFSSDYEENLNLEKKEKEQKHTIEISRKNKGDLIPIKKEEIIVQKEDEEEEDDDEEEEESHSDEEQEQEEEEEEEDDDRSEEEEDEKDHKIQSPINEVKIEEEEVTEKEKEEIEKTERKLKRRHRKELELLLEDMKSFESSGRSNRSRTPSPPKNQFVPSTSEDSSTESSDSQDFVVRTPKRRKIMKVKKPSKGKKKRERGGRTGGSKGDAHSPYAENFRLEIGKHQITVLVLRHQGNNGCNPKNPQQFYYQARIRNMYPQRHLWAGWEVQFYSFFSFFLFFSIILLFLAFFRFDFFFLVHFAPSFFL